VVVLLFHYYVIIIPSYQSYSSCLCLNIPTNSVRARFAISFSIPHVCCTEPPFAPTHPPVSSPVSCSMFHFSFKIPDSKFQNPNRNTTQPQPHPQQAKNSSIKKRGGEKHVLFFIPGRKRAREGKNGGKGKRWLMGTHGRCVVLCTSGSRQARREGGGRGRENNINNKSATSWWLQLIDTCS